MKVWMEEHIVLVAAILFVTNGVAFAMMGVDKRRARRNQWRITERALLWSAALFGGVGSMLGMYLFRHKTKHRRFTVLVPLFAAVQIGIIAALLL